MVWLPNKHLAIIWTNGGITYKQAIDELYYIIV